MKPVKCFKIKFPSYDENGKKLKKGGRMNRIFIDSLNDMMDNSLEMNNIIEELSSELSDKIDKDIINSIKGN